MSKPKLVLEFTSLIKFNSRKKISRLAQYMYFETKNLPTAALSVITGPFLPSANLISITATFLCSPFNFLNASHLQLTIFLSKLFSKGKACFLISSSFQTGSPSK